MKSIPSPNALNSSPASSLAAKSADLPADRLARRVQCPTCHKFFIYGESKFRPFCSERCRMVDLGRWFKEEYKVAAVDQTPEDEDAAQHGAKDDDDAFRE